MLKFKDNQLEHINETDLKSESILERYNLQEAIVSSWDSFKKEVGMTDLLYIGQEVCPHGTVENRIDILAYHANDNVPVVIELKRGKDKLQLLQSLSYASMVSTWCADDFIEIAKQNNSKDLDDLTSLIQDIDTESVRVVMVAEEYTPEVMLCANWLHSKYDLDITACAIKVFTMGESTVFDISKIFPLAELEDNFQSRRRKKSITGYRDTTWDIVKEKLKYSWGPSLIDKCLSIKDGDATRRRFLQIARNHDGLDWITLNFREKYLNIYVKGKPEDGEQFFKNKFHDDVEVSEWRDGWSVNISTDSSFQDLLKWIPSLS